MRVDILMNGSVEYSKCVGVLPFQKMLRNSFFTFHIPVAVYAPRTPPMEVEYCLIVDILELPWSKKWLVCAWLDQRH